MIEEWKDIVDYEGLYKISSLGNVKSLYSFKLLKHSIDTPGYSRVTLYKNGKGKHFSVHVLVAKHFIPNPLSLPIVHHKDECKTNPQADNLEWTTQSNNMRDYCARLVDQFTLGDKFIMTHESAAAAARSIDKPFAPNNITLCCQGKYLKAYGYKWKYSNKEVY